MKTVVVSAPGKVIVMGEHAVVYGKPALIATINKRLTVTVSESAIDEIIAPEGQEYIRHIQKNVFEHFKIKNYKLKIEVVSDIPIGYHLGSSAALGAALIGAMSYLLKNIWNPMLVSQLAYESEKFIHINSSGVDPAAVVSGGFIWYRKELDFLRSIWQLPFGLPEQLQHFYLLDTGRPKENTGEMVEYVNKQYSIHITQYKKYFDSNEEQTKRITSAIKEGDENSLIDAIRIGERTLEEIGVVSGKVIPIIREIEKQGGAAKILGGGGRTEGVGFLLCYDPNKSSDMQLGGEGIRLEKKQ